MSKFADVYTLLLLFAEWEWQGVAGNRLTNNNVETVETVNDVDCMNLCVLHDVCDSVNYRSSDSSCELNSHSSTGPDPGDLVADNDWVMWHL